MPLENGNGRRLQLSLRLAERDPWEQLPGALKEGRLVSGVVTGVVGYGAFIELALGLTGLLHYSQLPPGLKKSPMEVFWPGDSVRVKILEIDRKRRRISLGLPPPGRSPNERLREAIRSGFTQPEPEKVVTLAADSPDQVVLEHFLKHKPQRQRILIVEDDSAEARSLSFWFKSLQQHVDHTHRSARALELLQKSSPDLALIDAGLQDGAGIELACTIRERWPQVKVALLADLDQNASLLDLETLQALGIHTLIQPFTPEELIDLLMERENQAPRPAATIAAELKPIELKSVGLQNAIGEILQQTLAWTGFSTALLFQLDDLNRTIKLVHECGAAVEHGRIYPNLIFSPVRDVAEDQETVLLEQLSAESYGRFRYLIDEFSLTACMGIPVSSALDGNYALFLLDQRPTTLSREIQTYAQAAALVIGNLIQSHALQERTRLLESAAIRGQVAASLIHEFGTALGHITGETDALEVVLKDMEKALREGVRAPEKAGAARAHLQNLRRARSEAYATVQMFSELKEAELEVFRVDEVINRAALLMDEICRDGRIHLSVIQPDRMLLIRSHAASLLHVVINLLLNAVQQIIELRGGGGTVSLQLELGCSQNTEDRFKILVQDDGPG
ncbi:MAG TPA: S1 RNA-binding domain-containing protein, partial [Anaerolineales bacterium]|nr:S1 RNA-binding domain-containing protein [Anaerolineales bacterium]